MFFLTIRNVRACVKRQRTDSHLAWKVPQPQTITSECTFRDKQPWFIRGWVSSVEIVLTFPYNTCMNNSAPWALSDSVRNVSHFQVPLAAPRGSSLYALWWGSGVVHTHTHWTKCHCLHGASTRLPAGSESIRTSAHAFKLFHCLLALWG